MNEFSFKACIDLIGINPFVEVPRKVLNAIFEQAGKQKGHIPVKGLLNGDPYRQTLVKFKGIWRLYINTTMLKNSPARIGETITLTITFDPADRTIVPHPKWVIALNNVPEAKAIFERLSPSRRHEIVRYIAHLKTEESVDRNITKAINFLLGKDRFAGRGQP